MWLFIFSPWKYFSNEYFYASPKIKTNPLQTAVFPFWPLNEEVQKSTHGHFRDEKWWPQDKFSLKYVQLLTFNMSLLSLHLQTESQILTEKLRHWTSKENVRHGEDWRNMSFGNQSFNLSGKISLCDNLFFKIKPLPCKSIHVKLNYAFNYYVPRAEPYVLKMLNPLK